VCDRQAVGLTLNLGTAAESGALNGNGPLLSSSPLITPSEDVFTDAASHVTDQSPGAESTYQSAVDNGGSQGDLGTGGRVVLRHRKCRQYFIESFAKISAL